MLQTLFKILDGQYEKNAIFTYNVLKPRNIYFINLFLISLSANIPVKYESELQYAKLVEEILLNIKGYKIYDLEQKTTGSGYTNYKVVNVYDKEQEELPFS